MKCYQCRYWMVHDEWRPRNEDEPGPHSGAPCSLAEPRTIRGSDLGGDYLRWPHTDALDGCPRGKRLPLTKRIGWWLGDLRAWGHDALTGMWWVNEDGD